MSLLINEEVRAQDLHLFLRPQRATLGFWDNEGWLYDEQSGPWNHGRASLHGRFFGIIYR